MVTIFERDQSLQIRVGPATILNAETNRPGCMLIHPVLAALPDGSLRLTLNRERDVSDAEYLMLASEDCGVTWEAVGPWPSLRYPGSHPGVHCCLDSGRMLCTYGSTFATERPGHYEIPTWFSDDSGRSWSELHPAPVALPFGRPIDLYDPPDWWLAAFARQRTDGFIKPQPPAALVPLFERFGRSRLLGIFSLLSLGEDHLLAFLYERLNGTDPYSVVALESRDGGRSWSYLSTPGPYDPRHAEENFLTHPVNGFCEPSATLLPSGEILLVMRLGDRHPLYAVRSTDQGRSWTSPQALSVYGIFPTLIALSNGVLAMSAGRPHVTFNLSLDGGHRWAHQIKFLEDGNPNDASTRNNGMVAIADNRLLFAYDHGSWHVDYQGERRIVIEPIQVDLSPV